MSRTSIERKLVGLSKDLKRAASELAVIDEQLAYVAENAADARLRAMVSETPLADKEHRDAVKTVSALQKDRGRWAERHAKLERRQDELLDELLEGKT